MADLKDTIKSRAPERRDVDGATPQVVAESPAPLTTEGVESELNRVLNALRLELIPAVADEALPRIRELFRAALLAAQTPKE